MAAGGWAFLLLVWRLFDKPDVDDPGATVGIGWGIFVALLAAGALTAAGARVRAAHRPEPPNPAADDAELGAPAARGAPRRRGARARCTAVTEVLSKPPGWEGEPPEAAGPRAPRPERRRRAAAAADRTAPRDRPRVLTDAAVRSRLARSALHEHDANASGTGFDAPAALRATSTARYRPTRSALRPIRPLNATRCRFAASPLRTSVPRLT